MKVSGTRIRRIGIGFALAGIAATAIPAGASANIGYGAVLTPGSTACVQQYATYQVRGEGTATKQGARFTLSRGGAVINRSYSGTTSAWAAEARTAFGNFPGPGYYQVCATNHNSTNTLVNVRVLSDGEF